MEPLSILLVHNSYLYSGGEDAVVAQEKRLLESAGHRVVLYSRRNSEFGEHPSFLRRMAVLGGAVWATDSRRTTQMLIRRAKARVAHFHNTFPLISPSAYYAAKAEGVPVVQTLHNYRLLCANALLFRDGHPCEDCVGKSIGWPGVVRACYRRSRIASGVVAGATAVHRFLGTWDRAVDFYIVPSSFAREMFVRGGLSEDKLVVKPNFVDPDPGLGEHGGRFALFVGRLSPEKGIQVLLAAWRRLEGRVILKIVGDGPLSSEVHQASKSIAGVEWMGWRPKAEVLQLMQQAALLVLPSIVYEMFPLVVVEAFATGLPAMVSGHGALAELVEPGRTGLHFRPGDADDLAAKVEWAWTHPREMAEMGREARLEFERKYTAERNYQMLTEIYDVAMMRARH